MIGLLSMALAAAVAPASAASPVCTGTGRHDAAALRYICESERAATQSVANGDSSAGIRILADDFIGIGSSGKVFTKAQMTAQPAKTSQSIVFSDNDYVHVRFFGNTAVGQGQDTIRSKNGHLTHLLWTDTWLKRNGRWQVVQSQDIEQ
jgi:hypothetical protein